jgi:hypothetical protein
MALTETPSSPPLPSRSATPCYDWGLLDVWAIAIIEIERGDCNDPAVESDVVL